MTKITHHQVAKDHGLSKTMAAFYLHRFMETGLLKSVEWVNGQLVVDPEEIEDVVWFAE